MPVDLRLIPAHEFVRCTEDGALDAEASLALLVGAASGINVNRSSHILLDLRRADPGLDVLELHALGERVAGAGHSAARAFAGLDEALAWLGGA